MREEIKKLRSNGGGVEGRGGWGGGGGRDKNEGEGEVVG